MSSHKTLLFLLTEIKRAISFFPFLFVQGKIVQFDSYHKRHKVMYDDGEEEWVGLGRESFRYLTPRAKSAGCTASFRRAMAQLGADQEVGGSIRRSGHAVALQGLPAPRGVVATQPPAPEEAPNWHFSLQCASDGRWHGGEVLCYDPSRKRHLVLYEDGEDEWVDFAEEEVVWHCGVPEGREGIFPGKAPGVDPPRGRNAVGWRISVFWPGDAAFYPGEIGGYDEAMGQYEVYYDDGEEGTITVKDDRIKWILPPGVAVDHEALERMEVGGGRPRRRVTANGGDSDPDYEFEHMVGGSLQHARGGTQRRGGGGAFPRPRPTKHQYQQQQQQQQNNNNNSPSWDLQAEGFWSLPRPGPSQFHHAYSAPGALAGVVPEPAEPLVQENFGVEPSIVRHITRVPSFANLNSDTEARLPTAVTVRIYLSGSGLPSGSVDKAGASVEAAADGTPAATAEVKRETLYHLTMDPQCLCTSFRLPKTQKANFSHGCFCWI